MRPKTDTSNTASKVWIALSIPLVLLIYFTLRSQAIILILIVAGIILSLYRSLIPFNLGLELVTFSTVILAVTIGPVAAAIAALAIILFSHLLTGKLCLFIGVKAAVYSAFAFIAWALGGINIVFLGIFVTVVKNIVFELITFMMDPGRAAIDLPSAGINVLFNAWLFAQFGGRMISFLS